MKALVAERKDAFLDAYLKLWIVQLCIALLSVERFFAFVTDPVINKAVFFFFLGVQNILGLIIFISSIVAISYFRKKKFGKTVWVLPGVYAVVAVLQLIGIIIYLLAHPSPWLLNIPLDAYHLFVIGLEGSLLFYCVWFRQRIHAPPAVTSAASKATWTIIGLVIFAVAIYAPTFAREVPSTYRFDWQYTTFSLLSAALMVYTVVKSLKLLKQLRK